MHSDFPPKTAGMERGKKTNLTTEKPDKCLSVQGEVTFARLTLMSLQSIKGIKAKTKEMLQTVGS